ncbi:MAG: hypothetical protein ACK4RV_02205 [Caulobacter sp.]
MPENVWDFLEERERDAAEARVQQSFGRDPDQEARAQALGRRAGVPPAVASNQFRELDLADRRARAASILGRSPRTRAYVAREGNAEVVHDQLEGMSALESVLSTYRADQRDQAAARATERIADDVSWFETERGRGYMRVAPDGTLWMDGDGFSVPAASLRTVRPVMRDKSKGPMDVSRGATMGALPGHDPTVGSVVGNFFKARGRTWERAYWGLYQGWEDILSPVMGEGKVARREIARLNLDEESQRINFRYAPSRWLYGGAGSVLDVIPGVAVAVGTKNPWAGLAVAGGQTGTEAYGRYRERGGTIGESLLGAGGEAAIEVVTERIPMGFLVNRLGKGGAAQFIGGLLLRDLPLEQVATLTQDALDTAIANPDKTWGEFWQERPEAAMQTAVGTVLQAGVFGGAGALANISNARQQREAQAQAAYRQASYLDEAVAIVGNNALLARSPDHMREFAESLQGGDVFIPAEAMRTYLQSLAPSEQQQFLNDAGLQEQFSSASMAGADLVVPLSAYLTDIAPRAHEALREDIRTSLAGMSVREAKAFQDDPEAALEEFSRYAVDRSVKEAVARSPGERVYDAVFQQAREAGYTIDAANRYAALWAARYEARATRAGGDAWDAFSRSRVTIRQVLGEQLQTAQKVGRTDLVIDALRRGRRQAGKRGPSLLEFLAQRGGLNDEGGELSAMDADGWHKGKPGRRRLVNNDGGMTLGDAAVAAWENGYFPDAPDAAGDYYPVTGQDLLDAIRSEIAGTARYAVPLDQNRADFARAVAQLDELLSRLGIDVETASNADIKAALEQSTQEPDGQTYEQAARAEIAKVIEDAAAPGPHKAKANLGEVSDWLVKQGQEAGVNLAGFTHRIDSSAVNHIIKQHGDAAREERRGQVGITEEDILSIPTILAAPDQVVFGAKNNRGQDLVAFVKTLPDGHVLYVEEVRVGRKDLATATMRKFPPASDATRPAATLAPHVRNAPGGELKIVDVPPGEKAVADGRTFQQPAYHGSPHIFDSFSLDNIGTGEGAQAFGWGLYFAGKKEVAKYYRDVLSGYRDVRLDGEDVLNVLERSPEELGAMAAALNAKPMRLDSVTAEEMGRAASSWGWRSFASVLNDLRLDVTNDKQSPAKALGLLINRYSQEAVFADGNGDRREAASAALRAAYATALADAGSVTVEKPGRLYEVEIPEDGEYLLWDAPYSEQPPKVQAALRAVGIQPPAKPPPIEDPIIALIVKKALAASDGDPAQVEGVIDNDADLYRRAMGHAERRGISDVAAGEYVVGLAKEHLDAVGAASAMTGERIYRDLSESLAKPVDDMVGGGWAVVQNTIDDRVANDKAASLALREAGAAGIKFLDGTSRNSGEGTFNYVLFDDSRVSIRSFEQSARGDITFSDDGALIRLFEGRDLSTLLHEGGHLWLEELIFDAGDPFASDTIRADLATVRSWMGLADGEQIGVEHHEMFARGFEAYLMEGKAPSRALRDVFDRFKAWLVSIYRRFSALDVTLTPEIREVFDRLIATDEEIEAAKLSQALNPIFERASDADMTREEFDAYNRAVLAADEAATARLTDKVMEEVRRKRTREWNAERRTLKEELASVIDTQPDIAALTMLRKGEAILSREAIVDLYGTEEVLARLPKGVPPIITRDGGMHPEALAGLVGFDSGSSLIDALMGLQAEQDALRAAGDKRRVRDARLDAEVDRIMNERHGDMLSDGSIQEEALDAVNEERRAELLETEARLLARKAGRDTSTWSRDAMIAYARQEVSRRKAKDIKPSLHLRAEQQAGREAQRALLKGDAKAALDAKFRQLLNLHLYRAARDAAEMVDKAQKLMARYGSVRTLKGMDQDYLDQIHDILERVDYRQISLREIRRRVAFRQWIEERRAEGDDIDPPTKLMDEAFRQNYATMTVDELSGLYDTIRNIAHLGRMKKRLLADQEQREFDAAADELFDTIVSSTKRRKDIPPTDRLTENVRRLKDNFFASHRKIESMARELDGFSDMGPAWRYLYDGINRAGDAKSAEMADVAKAVGGLFRSYSRVERAKMHLERRFYDEVGTSLSKWQVISIALNWGNEENRTALVEGWTGRTDASLATFQTLLDRAMDERDWRFVQGVWDYLDTFYPRIAAHEREMTGIVPEKVEPMAVVTPFGTFKGGYYPLKYDRERSERAYAYQAEERAKQMLSGGFSRPTTRKGHTKERVGSAGQPVRIDINVMLEHLGDVVHDLTHRKALLDANRLANDKRVVEAIKQTMGPEYHRALNDWIKDVAAGDVLQADWLDRVVNHVRGGVTIFNMGWKFSTAAVQFMGYTQSIARLGERWAAVGLAKFYGDPMGMAKKVQWITDVSPYMAGRFTTFDRDINDMRKQIGPKSLTAELEASFFYGIAMMDRAVAIPTWIGAYEKHMAEHGNEEASIAFADSVVRLTQSSGGTKDLAQIQRGGPLKRLFTAFYSYFNSTWNMNVDEVRMLGEKGVAYAPRFAINMLWINIIPAVLTEMVLGRGPDEDDEWWAWAGARIFGYVGGGLVGVRDLVSGLVSDYGYSFSPVAQVGERAVDFGKQVQQGEVDRALVKSGWDTLGVALHLPGRQIWITSEAAVRAVNGEEVPVADYLMTPPKD